MDIPQIIAGRFRIECEIGRGGMGTVYRASHLGLERPVAVKVLKKEFTADPEVAERFMREARTMARLRHTRAAMIFDAGRLSDGRPFIVMEYAEGQTLAEALQGDGPFAPARAVRVASEICEVLGEAHALGIVHRDLKPSNIMLTERGVCVLDFGIAKVLAAAGEATRTHATTESGLVIGTPRYMSPEQCLGQRVGPASDLYSVGVILYEMLAGHPPFVDELASAVLVKQATQTPPPLVALRPDVPRPLALAAHTLLSKNPANRPRTALEARTLLEKSIAPPPRTGDVETTPFASTIDAMNTGRASFVRVVGACAIIAMLGAVALVWANKTEGSTARAMPTLKSVTAATAVKPSTPKARASAPREARLLTTSNASDTKPPSLTNEDARRIAAAASSHGVVTDARLIRAGSAQVIAAIHDETREGQTHLFVMQGDGRTFRVKGRAPLDTKDFRGARWTQEVVDIDGDGHDELLCAGSMEQGKAARAHRYVLFVPRTGQTYSLTVGPEPRRPNARRSTTWSSNAVTAAAHPFRVALMQRASSVVGSRVL